MILSMLLLEHIGLLLTSTAGIINQLTLTNIRNAIGQHDCLLATQQRGQPIILLYQRPCIAHHMLSLPAHIITQGILGLANLPLITGNKSYR